MLLSGIKDCECYITTEQIQQDVGSPKKEESMTQEGKTGPGSSRC